MIEYSNCEGEGLFSFDLAEISQFCSKFTFTLSFQLPRILDYALYINNYLRIRFK